MWYKIEREKRQNNLEEFLGDRTHASFTTSMQNQTPCILYKDTLADVKELTTRMVLQTSYIEKY